MGLYLRMGHVSRRWGLAQLCCIGVLLVCAVLLAVTGRRSFTGGVGYLAFGAFATFVILSFLSKRGNNRDERPQV
jgi:hypothetical protein